MKHHPNNENIILTGNEVTAYVWPGGYPLFYITEDSEVLCPDCVQTEIKSCTDKEDGQWFVVASGVNWEDDNLNCIHCEKLIPAAYVETPVKEEMH